ncbi:phage major capsid protein [Cupriavidus pauculus]|nr:phage major capsid protein [Cupriavidus pauculus]
MDNFVIQKQLTTAREQLQAALDRGDDAAADALMARTKALQQEADAGHVTTTATPTTRSAAKASPTIEAKALPLWRGLAVQVVAALERKTPAEIAAARYGSLGRKDADALGVIMKAVQDPATTNVPGWAQELTREVQGAFLAELAKLSVFASLPLVTENFNGATSITIPSRDTTNANPNLAAGWRKEGAPIRVGAIKVKGTKLTPYAPAVIGTFTQELARRSTPRIEQIIREAIVSDSAAMFDAKFLSADAAVPDVSPAGILDGLPAANSIPSTGATPAEIAADLKHMAGLLLKSGLDASGFAWCMSPYNSMALSMLLTATGALQFPEMASGRLIGLPFVVSANVPDDSLFLIDGGSIARALPAPEFSVSVEASIHEEDTTPLPIIDDAGMVAPPTRSLFQTYSAALRGVYDGLSWGALRPGAVAHLTGVAW